MMIRILFSIFTVFSTILFSQNLSEHVNPFIGTGGHGHTFPGATVPFGMIQLSPDTRIDGSWDGCSGYHYSDNVIYGFSHTHLNGTGVSDYGDIMLMPTMGKPSLKNSDYSSKFSHSKEKASAGFYSVNLSKHNIDVRLTTTTKVGYHEYTFNKSGQANIILDLNHRDFLEMGEVKIIDDKTIEVYRKSQAWAENQQIYARIEFSKPMKISKELLTGLKLTNQENTNTNPIFRGKQLALAFSSNVKAKEKIKVKVALSFTGYEGAEKNMRAEGETWDFDEIHANAKKSWDNELSKIIISETDKNKLSIFYTALYHVSTQPNIANDVDGNYLGRDFKIHHADHDYYTVFSLWDTFRGYHPLMALINQKRTADFINTFILQYEQGKRLPIWELAANETYCMIGYHSVSVMADAMAKNIQGFDYEKAFEAAKNSAENFDDFGMKAYRENGFISIDDEHESVSKTLEYAYDDWCIAQMAKMLGKKDDYQRFMERSQSWKNVYNSKNGFMQARKNGGWFTPFDPREVNNQYTEGNSWHYSFFVPQDIQGLISKHGGKENFEKFLDELFSAPTQTTGREQVDITGLIGQYAHGNEPSHHIIYLYNDVNKPEKTNEKIKFVLDNFYKNAPDGLIGNEDCGQMSAWYVLSTLGIYNVTPGQNEWHTTTPYFENAKLFLEDGTTREITPSTPSETLKNLGFENVKSNSKAMKYDEIVEVPIIEASRFFEFKNEVKLSSTSEKDKLSYQLKASNSDQFSKSEKYKNPFEIFETTTVNAVAKRNGKKSKPAKATLYRKPNNWTIDIKSVYNPQYHAGGNTGLIDGILGTENWRKGDWQGYQSQDFVATIDLQSPQKITEISSRYLQDSRSWILMPKKVEYFASNNNKDFFLLGTVTHDIDPKNTENIVKDFTLKVLPTETRYVKIVAQNFGKLPNWHQGSGGDAFIFVDEITVK